MIPIQYELRRRMMGIKKQKVIQWWVDELSYVDYYLSEHQPFKALSDMTWAEWCDSIYNPSPVEGGWAAFYVGEYLDGTDGVVCIGNKYNVLTNGPGERYVFGSDVIIEDHHYFASID